jgi:hypothetical protein
VVPENVATEFYALWSALSLIVGSRLSGIDWGMLLPHDPTEVRVADFVDIVLGWDS